MRRKSLMRWLWSLGFAAFLGLIRITAFAAAQPQCGYVESVAFPVDTSVFQLVQGFGVPNARHRGWYHTGEDWWGGRGQSLAQPVHAIAAGRVTLSSPIVWGRDGGVVILEHTFTDGSIYYSQYGHMIETDTVQFPRPYTCVAAGDVIGAIGEARPAPHLHFEIRINNFDLPGPGYTETDPYVEGYRYPSKLITNWQTWLSPVHRWHLDLIDEAGPLTPPVVLPDESLIYLDTGRVSRVTNDGRVLWRYNLERPAVALLAREDGAWIVYQSGHVQAINADGMPGESWETGVSPEGTPIDVGSLIVFHTADNALIALDEATRVVAWRLPDVPPIARWAASSGVLGLITTTGELLVVSAQGESISRQALGGSSALAALPDGQLVLYSSGELIPVDAPYNGSTEARRSDNPLLVAPDGRAFIWDNGVFTAYASDQQLLWQYAVPGLSGAFDLALYGDVLLLASNHGYVAAVRAGDGALCGSAQVFGDGRARVWQRLGADNILRVAVADQISGLDWRTLLGPCTP